MSIAARILAALLMFGTPLGVLVLIVPRPELMVGASVTLLGLVVLVVLLPVAPGRSGVVG